MPPKPAARRPIIPEICPDCGEKGTIVIDEYLGEIHCTECGIVLKGGLEEREESAFHDDQIKDRNQQQDMYAGGNTTANGGSNKAGGSSGAASAGKANRRTRYSTDVIQHIASLRTQLDAPEAVSLDAKALLPDFLNILAGEDSSADDGSFPQSIPSAPQLAVALVHIASYVQHYPISLSQATQTIQSKAPNLQVAKDLVGAILDALKIELPTPEKTLADFVSVLLSKLQYRPMEPISTMASAMAASFDSAVSSRYEPRVVAAVSVFLCCWSKSCREKLAPRVCDFLNKRNTNFLVQVPAEVKWSNEEKENLEKKLTLFIGDEDSLMRKCIGFLTSDKTVVGKWVQAAADRFPEAKIIKEGGELESGVRRQREE